MPKIIEYHLEEAVDAELLRVGVNDAVKEGWQPLGQAFIGPSAEDVDAPAFFQTLVRYAE